MVGDDRSGSPWVDPLTCWRRVRESAETAPELRRLLDELLGAAAQGVDAQTLDGRIDRALPDLAPADVLKSIRDRMAGKLDSYRDRMSTEVLQGTIRRAVVEQLRREVGLPRLGSDETLRRSPRGDEASAQS